MERQERAVPRPAEYSVPLGLLFRRNLSKVVDGTVGAPYTWMYMQIQRITRASYCATVVWLNLERR